MKVPRPGVQSELQLPAYTTATATEDPSRVCDLHHSAWQRWILNPLNHLGTPQVTLFPPLSSQLLHTSSRGYALPLPGRPFPAALAIFPNLLPGPS